MIFNWKNEYSTGISAIDLQHRRLFEIGSNIYELATLNDGVDHFDEIMQILDNLKNYAIYHFEFEESYMRSKNFDNIVEHKKLHVNFIDKILSINDKDVDNKQKQVLLKLLDFIANWIGNHILKEDFRYKDL